MSSTISDPTVYVVDDDPAVLASLKILLGTDGFVARTFRSAEELLTTLKVTGPVCMLIDVCLPGMGGLELQYRLAEMEIESVLILMTGQASVPMAVQALRAGAFHFIEKPFDPKVLLEAIRQAYRRRCQLVERRMQQDQAAARLQCLTAREREVLDLLVEGHVNKVIASRLGISTRTAEHHRAHIMAKLNARTLPQLLRLSLASQAGASDLAARALGDEPPPLESR